MGLVSCGVAKSLGAEQQETGEKGLVLVVLGAEEARCLSDSSAILCSEPK